MNIEQEKQQIIAALQQRDEEWLIVALQKLLDIEPAHPFSDEHKTVIEERIEAYKKNPNDFISLDELKETFRNEGRWQQ